VIAYAFDDLRRSQSQKVTTLGGSTDGAVRSITRGYDSLGRVDKITSHGNQTDDPDNTADIENQIVYTYNSLGRITKSEQSHSGAVGGSTPSVQYSWDISVVSGLFNDGNRLVQTTYPDGRVLYNNYGSANTLEDRMNSVRQLRETSGSGTVLAQYSRTGSGLTVKTDYLQPDLRQDLVISGGTYNGLDRFGRTVDHRWYDYTSGTVDRARYTYGHDYNSSRTWKEDPVADSNSVDQDEFFAYDGLNRLKAADRGDLNGGKTAISTLTFGQDWDLDQLGNWPNFTEDTDGNGTNDLDQDRTHNDANEITDIDASSTHVAHDAAGNMTTVPQPGSWSTDYDLTWDAWNRLVKVVDGANTVAEYQYDGKNRRIVKKLYSGGSLDETRHIYLSMQNQVLEERVDSSTSADRQFTWGDRYVDDLVLRTRDTDSNGSLDETLYALQDANWNVTALADTGGAVVERFVYNAYGRSTVLDPDFTADGDGLSDYAWEYRFTSREYDSETGMHYFRARYYHDGIGRFIGRDPLGYVATALSQYLSLESNPSVYLDPLGMDAVVCSDGGHSWMVFDMNPGDCGLCAGSQTLRIKIEMNGPGWDHKIDGIVGVPGTITVVPHLVPEGTELPGNTASKKCRRLKGGNITAYLLMEWLDENALTVPLCEAVNRGLINDRGTVIPGRPPFDVYSPAHAEDCTTFVKNCMLKYVNSQMPYPYCTTHMPYSTSPMPNSVLTTDNCSGLYNIPRPKW